MDSRVRYFLFYTLMKFELVEDEILDFEERKEVSKYALRSIKLLIFGIICYALFVVNAIFFLLEEEWLLYLILATYLIVFITSLIGLINGIISILKKEKSIFIKCAGTIGNTIMVVIMALILFANALDFYRFFTE